MAQRSITHTESTEIGLALFAGDEALFASSVPAIAPQPDDALVFWANKRPVIMPKGRGHANVSPEYSGFLVPTDQLASLDEAMERAGATTVEFPTASHVGGITVYARQFTQLVERAVEATSQNEQ